MPLILAVEPDRKQADAVTNLARNVLRSEVIVTDSADEALAVMAKRVPDLLLTSLLLPPRDEAKIADRLRELDAAGTNVQTLVIPMLAVGGKHGSEGKRGRLWKSKARSATPDGCAPEVFAGQISEYLRRASVESVSRSRHSDAHDDVAPSIAHPSNGNAAPDEITHARNAPAEPPEDTTQDVWAGRHILLGRTDIRGGGSAARAQTSSAEAAHQGSPDSGHPSVQKDKHPQKRRTPTHVGDDLLVHESPRAPQSPTQPAAAQPIPAQTAVPQAAAPSTVGQSAPTQRAIAQPATTRPSSKPSAGTQPSERPDWIVTPPSNNGTSPERVVVPETGRIQAPTARVQRVMVPPPPQPVAAPPLPEATEHIAPSPGLEPLLRKWEMEAEQEEAGSAAVMQAAAQTPRADQKRGPAADTSEAPQDKSERPMRVLGALDLGAFVQELSGDAAGSEPLGAAPPDAHGFQTPLRAPAAQPPAAPHTTATGSAAHGHAGAQGTRTPAEPAPLRPNADGAKAKPAESSSTPEDGANGRPQAKRRAVQDEWGVFDPQQAGFAALFAKLEEISEQD